MKSILMLLYKTGDTYLYELKKKANVALLKYYIGATKPGTKAYSLWDHGDGFRFKDHFLNKSFNIDYAQMEALYILMKELNYEVDYKKFKEDNQK